MLIFIDKNANRTVLYGSLDILFKNESEIIQLSINTIYSKRNLKEEDYEDDNCKIMKRELIRGSRK
jgi:hypothetical protein